MPSDCTGPVGDPLSLLEVWSSAYSTTLLRLEENSNKVNQQIKKSDLSIRKKT